MINGVGLEALIEHTGTLQYAFQAKAVRSLAFLSVDGIYRAMGEKGRDPVRPQYTDHCFTGDYPTQLTDIGGDTKAQLSLLAEAS
jgi:amidophosphoribosyltransferase